MSQIREISEAFLYLFKMVSKKKIQRERIQKVFCFFLQHQLLGQLCNFDRLQQIKGKQHKFVYIHIS